MQIVASAAAAELIREQGGRLYVWLKRARCCGSLTTLAAAAVPPAGREFRLVGGGDFELYLPADIRRLPEELHIDVARFRRGVEAYWNGCAWVI